MADNGTGHADGIRTLAAYCLVTALATALGGIATAMVTTNLIDQQVVACTGRVADSEVLDRTVAFDSADDRLK